jgi:two-component system, cell cycle response regulator
MTGSAESRQPLEAPAPQGASAEPIKILLVDERADTGWQIQQVLAQLQPCPYQWEYADGLAAGLERIQRSSFQAVLLALTLPDSQGLDTFLRLHRQAPGLPVVVLTRPQDEALGHIAVREGAQDYLVEGRATSHQVAQVLAQAITRQKLQSELSGRSLADELTGLFSRTGFFALAQQHWKLAYRTNRPFLLIVAKLSTLKHINATLGHRVGDAALLQTAKILRQTFRDSDLLARWGGDDFVMLVTEVPPDGGEGLLARLANNLKLYNLRKTASFELELSIGKVCFDPAEPVALEDLISSAISSQG